MSLEPELLYTNITLEVFPLAYNTVTEEHIIDVDDYDDEEKRERRRSLRPKRSIAGPKRSIAGPKGSIARPKRSIAGPNRSIAREKSLIERLVERTSLASLWRKGRWK